MRPLIGGHEHCDCTIDLERAVEDSVGLLDPAVRVTLPARAAERSSVLFHHRSQDLLASVEARIEERFLDIGEDFEERKRDLHARRPRTINELEMTGLLGMLVHGGSFVV